MDIKDILASVIEAASQQRQERAPLSYAKSAPVMTGYTTKLDPLREMAFQGWVQKNNVPFDPSANADYDMRGFYKAQVDGSPVASSGINENDGRMHFTDYFKTPAHQSFSAESKWATNGAPRWNEVDQLALPSGKIVFDERNRK
ncbi:Hypothetical protein HEAR2282 [Herminiimonas arsenicoxydans]|uniref:Uncharacterized protein n=1 Tax=Herminiimonas arsenicoxydans TaxID=204773 RepID=A4G7C8_HERAR|nr:Hypothetical protein HEAR2282 [Herminiimonas arsenicoxydans]